MPPRKNKKDFEPHIQPDEAPHCCHPGCNERGLYKAPKSRDSLHEYEWYCLDHIRERNQSWDYFNGMDRDDIEQFMKDAVTGHRPTWNRESHLRGRYEKLQDAVDEFLNFKPKPKKTLPPLEAKLRKALALLDLEYPFTVRELKSKYRLLVKQHHPDVNKGNKLSEEKFKAITSAYKLLNQHLEKL